jgi:hypothetical protein
MLLLTVFLSQALSAETPADFGHATLFFEVREGRLHWVNDERFVTDALLVRVWWIALLHQVPDTDGTLTVPLPRAQGQRLYIRNVDRQSLTFTCEPLLPLDGSAQVYLVQLGCHPFWLEPDFAGWRYGHDRDRG